MKQFETKAAHLVDGADALNDDCAKKLGVRDTETAVEDFINANTQVTLNWMLSSSYNYYKTNHSKEESKDVRGYKKDSDSCDRSTDVLKIKMHWVKWIST